MSSDITTEVKPVEAVKVVEAGLGDSDGFALAQRVATALSKSTLIPKDYQTTCLIA